LVALDPLSECGQRAFMSAYAGAGRRGEALRQYKNCAASLKRELGVAPDDETQALAHQIANLGAAGEPCGVTGAADRTASAAHDWAPERPNMQRSEASASGTVMAQWPCLLPSLAVAVAPLRNLTGDPDQQYLVEAFTDDLVTDLLRHGRGLSLKPLADVRAEGGYDYVVTGSAQRSNAGILRINMRITNASTSEYLWAGRHEFRPEDLASIQTKITRRISRELHALLLQAASRRASTASGIELDIAECLSRAAAVLEKGMRADLSAEAQHWYLAALAGDPRNVEALTGLARTCQFLVSNPWWGDPRAAVAASDLLCSGTVLRYLERTTRLATL